MRKLSLILLVLLVLVGCGEESEEITDLITEASYQLIPNTSAEDRLYQVEIEEGNWRIDENSLTLTYLDEDGSSLSLIYTKSK